MTRSLSDYARLFLIDEQTFRLAHRVPVLIWEAGGSQGAPTVEPFMGTRAGLSARRPTAGDPLVLEVKKGHSKANAFALGITVGRAETNDIPIDDESVSRFHAWLADDGKGWKLVDAESKNGTWIGAMKLDAKKPEPVRDGTRLKFGDIELTFYTPDAFFAFLMQMAK